MGDPRRGGLRGLRHQGRPKKLAALWVLVLEHFQPLEADFQRVYNLDLGAELWATGTVRLRRLLTLIYHLPPDSEFIEDIGLAAKARWTMTHELLANLIELTDVGVRKGTKRRRPLITIRRPWKRGSPGEGPVSMQSTQARRFFGGRVHYEPKPEPESSDS